MIAICALALVTFVIQREYLRFLNRKKERSWSEMSIDERASYQNDNEAREADGNRRLDFRFKY